MNCEKEYFKRTPFTIAFVNPNKLIILINPVLSWLAKVDICIMIISICILISLFQIRERSPNVPCHYEKPSSPYFVVVFLVRLRGEFDIDHSQE